MILRLAVSSCVQFKLARVILAFLSLARFWRIRERLCMTRVRCLLSMRGMLLRYSFKSRPYSRALGIAGSVETIGFINKWRLALGKPVWRETTRFACLWSFLAVEAIWSGLELFLSPFFHFSFLYTAPAKLFWRLFTCLIRNNLTNIFKTARHVEQSKENKFPLTSSMYLFCNRSWATTNHSTRSFHA